MPARRSDKSVKPARQPRWAAALATQQCLDMDDSIEAAVNKYAADLSPRDKGFVRYWTARIVRFWPILDAQLQQRLRKRLKGNKQVVEYLIALGILQLDDPDSADHAAVHASVDALPRKWQWAKGLVNAVLRGFARDQQPLLNEHAAQQCHPDWWQQRIAQDWPEQAEQIFQANLEQPPLWLRVTPQGREALEQNPAFKDITVASAVVDTAVQVTQPCDVHDIPGFTQGWCSVQDGGAQLAALLLDPQPGEKILDACAAPGGKTAHLLQHCADIAVTAADIEPNRLQKIEQNLARIGASATLIQADLTGENALTQTAPFDRILLDVPCTASGVVRRHPEILRRRSAQNLEQVAATQQQILRQAWTLLKPGGRLLYVTCSIFRRENDQQIKTFVAVQTDAKSAPLATPCGKSTPYGFQILPGGPENFDGFFYALLEKDS